MFDLSEKYAVELDKMDPLNNCRDRFYTPDENLIYLDGNSLGRPLKESIDEIENQLKHRWADRLIRSWNEDWYEKNQVLGDKIAQIAGAEKGEVIVTDSTSVNLYKLAKAALKSRPERKKIITDQLNFPSDLYILQGIIEEAGAGYELIMLEATNNTRDALQKLYEEMDDQTVLVLLSHVLFKSSMRYPMKEVAEIVHKYGAYIMWDLSHSIGAVPIEMSRSESDMAVGCTYKYLNGGPGSPAFLYVRKDLQEKLNSPIQGWFGAENPFDFTLEYTPANSIRKFLAGTSPVLSLIPLEKSLDLIIEIGMYEIWQKSQQQTEYLLSLYDSLLKPLGFDIASSRSADERGSHISFRHHEAYRICKSLIDDSNGSIVVIPDFREPDFIRLGITPLYTTYSELFLAIKEMENIVKNSLYERYSHDKEKVT